MNILIGDSNEPYKMTCFIIQNSSNMSIGKVIYMCFFGKLTLQLIGTGIPKLGLVYLVQWYGDTHKIQMHLSIENAWSIVTDFLKSERANVLPHPPYSPDLAPCDFSYFQS